LDIDLRTSKSSVAMYPIGASTLIIGFDWFLIFIRQESVPAAHNRHLIELDHKKTLSAGTVFFFWPHRFQLRV